MHITRNGEYRNFQQSYHQGETIEKHAGAPITNRQHPHQKYKHLNRLSIEVYDEKLKQLWCTKTQNKKGKMIMQVDYNKLNEMKIKQYKCRCDNKIACEKILQPLIEDHDIIVYKTCPHTVIAAAKRQMKNAPIPDPDVADDFIEFSKRIIEKEMGDYLTNFGYSFDQWYNHLNLPKQKKMDIIHQIYHSNTMPDITPQQYNKIIRQRYEGIGKVEIQPTDGKPRMVCSIPDKTKYIMGPVCWKLEELFQDHFKGYCGGKNLDEMADMINEYIDQGFTKVVEGDGSAFDNTQDVSLKEIDRYIYKRVKDKIYHVPQKDFLQESQKLTKTMDITILDPLTKQKRTLFTYTILGSVFSGDADTTLCNTIRMALYNRYVNEKAGFRYGIDYVVFSKGDDFTVMYKNHITNKQIEQAYYKYFLRSNPDPTQPDDRIYGLGQVLKFLEIGGPEIIKFCSLRAWFKDESHIYLTRDPKKFVKESKYSRKTKTMTEYQRYQYLTDQADAIRKQYNNIKYFEQMAEIYEQHAQLIKIRMGINFKILKQQYDKKQLRLQNRQEQNSRKTIDFDKYYEKYYNTQGRRTFIKIQESYWETMQKIEKAHTKTLTQKEADYVNKQIRMEFSEHYLKALLGLK